jgi:hypothetical protein
MPIDRMKFDVLLKSQSPGFHLPLLRLTSILRLILCILEILSFVDKIMEVVGVIKSIFES